MKSTSKAQIKELHFSCIIVVIVQTLMSIVYNHELIALSGETTIPSVGSTIIGDLLVIGGFCVYPRSRLIQFTSKFKAFKRMLLNSIILMCCFSFQLALFYAVPDFITIAFFSSLKILLFIIISSLWHFWGFYRTLPARFIYFLNRLLGGHYEYARTDRQDRF